MSTCPVTNTEQQEGSSKTEPCDPLSISEEEEMKKIFDKKYTLEYLKGIGARIGIVEGYDEVADEYMKLLNVTNDNTENKMIIPHFIDNKVMIKCKDIFLNDEKEEEEEDEADEEAEKNTDNGINKEKKKKKSDDNLFKKQMIECIKRKRLEMYKKKALTVKDVDLICKKLHYPDQRQCQRKNINFPRFRKDFPQFSYLFRPNITNKQQFLNPNKMSDFNVVVYCEFIRKLYFIQDSILCLINICPTLSATSISQDDFEAFVLEYSRKIPSLGSLHSNFTYFTRYYVLIVAKYMSLFFSEFNNNQLNLKNLLLSDLLQKFVDIANQREKNPFTMKETTYMYNMYMKLDTGKMGNLSKSDLKFYPGLKFTNAFIDRLFEMLQLYEGYLDFSLFIILSAALKNISTPNGTKFFFDIIDLDGRGYIIQSDITYFYKAMLKEAKQENDFDYFLSRIYDLISCSDEKITMETLIKSKCQNLFFKLLIDVETFLSWEVCEGGDEEEEGDEEEDVDDDDDDSDDIYK